MNSGKQKHLPSKQLYISRRNQTGAHTVNTLLTGLEVPRSLILTLFPLIADLSLCVCVCMCVCVKKLLRVNIPSFLTQNIKD
jgi:hypothetical protein